jgi:hypothetical protein
MKSIKEKAIEVFPRHCNANTDYSNFKKRIGFNSGANYVLDILEKELPLEDNRNLNDYGKALVWRLKECIEQLKK